jgi:hypothetical protein
MKIVGCDLHARQQTIAMLDTETGEFSEKTLAHEGNTVREFYAALDGPVVVGIEATGAMPWFLELLEELGVSSAGWVIQRRSGQRRRGSKSMIAAMRGWS